MKIIAYLFLLASLFSLVSCNEFSTSSTIPLKDGERWKVSDAGDSVLYRYDKKGKVISFTTYKNRYKHGLAKKFYDDGQIEFVINYKEGYKDGEVLWYYDNRKLYRQSHFVNGKIEGIQKKYYKSGQLMAEIPHENGEVIIGTKEFLKDGKLKKIYPKIKHEFIDNIAFDNEYIVKLYLSEKSKTTKFFRVYTMPEDGSWYKMDIPTSGGVGRLTFTIRKNGFLMEKVKIRAEYKTSLGNMVVLEKNINVAIDNSGI